MSSRQRPPRPPPPPQAELYVDDYNYGQALTADFHDRDSPPGSTHNSSADVYRTPVPRNAHAPQGSYSSQGRTTALATSTSAAGPFGDDMAAGGSSPPSVYGGGGGDQYLRLQRDDSQASPSERDSFFAPPAMPWMRNENSQPPSRSQSPSLYGAPRTSSASPMPFYPQSVSHYSGASTYGASRPKRQFVSHLVTGEIDKPWLKQKDRWLQAAWWVTVLLWFLGVVGTAILCFFTYRNVPHLPNDLCLVMNEQFSSGSIDSNNWNHEVSVSGFGNGGFEWTTESNTNSFVQGGKLYIVPTLTSEGGKYSVDQILNGVNDKIDGCTDGDDSNAYFKDKVVGSAVGLQKRSFWQRLAKRPVTDDDDTGNDPKDGGGANGATGGGQGRTGQHDACQVVSDRTARVAVNPVQSARLTTRGKHTVKYGRVEIRAKMPTGDWLYPQIMMLPASTVYGNWPLSGEIDLVMARGNDANYARGGRDFITSGLQWGPGVGFNAFDRTRGWYQQRRTNFNQAFHTFAVEWTDKFMWTYVDSRVHRVINLDLKKKSFFQRGKFPLVFRNGTDDQILQNPWRDHNNAAPFDQDFYLVLTVQAGGTNGWFEDRIGKKPWFDRSGTAMFDFANATSTWSKTWPKNAKDRAMVIDSVKMWQVGKCAQKSSN